MTDQLKDLADLQWNWDGDGAEPITKHAMATARILLSPPVLVPTTSGGIQLEWHEDGKDIEIVIMPDGSLDCDL